MQGARSKLKSKADADLPFPAGEVAKRLLAWYGRAGRELPWRKTRDPYPIWLSEIMLQQTRVEAVKDYFQRFLASFPDIRALAAAPLDEVIDLWAGLGYYARARNLHAAARMLVTECGGSFPPTVEELMRLPGIGRSTAGAISALAFDRAAPILDGNVRRILCRLLALREPPRSASADRQLWLWAERLTPQHGVHDYTQAIMDLGAVVCTPSSPRCETCPLERLCQARRLKLVERLPLKTPKKAIPLRRELALLLVSAGRCQVRRRPAEGLLGGLWEFPTLAAAADPLAAIRAYCAADTSFDRIRLLGQAQHVYSHFRLEVDFYRVDLQPMTREGADEPCWLPLEALPQLALHGAHKKLLPLIGA